MSATTRLRLNFPSDCNWPLNKKTSQRDHPKRYWLFFRLYELNNDARLVDHHAGKIHFTWRLLKIHRTSHKIGGNDREGYDAKRILANKGLANDLTRLLRAARTGSQRRFLTAMAAVSDQAQSVCKIQTPPIIKRTKNSFQRRKLRNVVGFSTTDGSFSIIAPRAEDAVPLIERAIRELKKTPNTERRKRRRASHEADAIAVVKTAYEALTGKCGKRSWDAHKGIAKNAFIKLGQDIDAEFKTMLFGKKDSSRLRPTRAKKIEIDY